MPIFPPLPSPQTCRLTPITIIMKALKVLNPCRSYAGNRSVIVLHMQWALIILDFITEE